jgi:hypothetical protein
MNDDDFFFGGDKILPLAVDAPLFHHEEPKGGAATQGGAVC